MKRKTKPQPVQVSMPEKIAKADLSDYAKVIYAILLRMMIDNMNNHTNYSAKEKARYIKFSLAGFSKETQLPQEQIISGLAELKSHNLVISKVAYANFRYLFLPDCEQFIEKE